MALYFLYLAGKMEPVEDSRQKAYKFEKNNTPMPGKGKRDPKKEKMDDKETVVFKPAHIKRKVKKLTKMRVSRSTLRACSAGLTYFLMEILEGARSCCQNEGKKKMSPRHIGSAIALDTEIHSALRNYVIQSGGSRQFSLPEITRKN